jgi:hypothetical protein
MGNAGTIEVVVAQDYKRRAMGPYDYNILWIHQWSNDQIYAVSLGWPLQAHWLWEYDYNKNYDNLIVDEKVLYVAEQARIKKTSVPT